MKNLQLIFMGAFLAVFSCFTVPASAELILHYTFDEVSGDALDTGASPAANSALYGPGIGRVTGVSGTGKALTLGTGRPASESNYTSTSGSVDKINNLSAFSVSFWLNAQGPITAYDCVFSSIIGSQAGIKAYVTSVNTQNNSFILAITVNDGNGNTVSKSAGVSIDADNKWVFFAYTFEGTNGNLTAYYGDETNAVTGSSMTTTLTTNGTSAAKLMIGKIENITDSRTPPVFVDDFRIYNTVLSSAELDAVRLEAVPEPVSATVLLFWGGIVFCLQRRKVYNYK